VERGELSDVVLDRRRFAEEHRKGEEFAHVVVWRTGPGTQLVAPVGVGIGGSTALPRLRTQDRVGLGRRQTRPGLDGRLGEAGITDQPRSIGRPTNGPRRWQRGLRRAVDEGASGAEQRRRPTDVHRAIHQVGEETEKPRWRGWADARPGSGHRRQGRSVDLGQKRHRQSPLVQRPRLGLCEIGQTADPGTPAGSFPNGLGFKPPSRADSPDELLCPRPQLVVLGQFEDLVAGAHGLSSTTSCGRLVAVIPPSAPRTPNRISLLGQEHQSGA
jgi:hypothetical protein